MKKGLNVLHLPDASQVTSEDAAVEAYSQVLDCVQRANGELAKSKHPAPDDDADEDYDDLSNRLREWLVALHRVMKVIIHYLPHAASYSFTFGTTISMTMNFVKQPREVSPPTSA